jgi:hypothetical protein
MQNEDFQECLWTWTICIMNGVTTLSIGSDDSKIRMEINPSYLKQSWTNLSRFGTLSLAFPVEIMTLVF